MLRKILFILCFFLLAFPVQAARPSLQDQVQEFRLKNGMTFLLVRREGPPVFAGYIRVKVGGVDEIEGKTGIAHLLEHMAFKGTPTIGTKNYAEEKKVLAEIERVNRALQTETQKGKESSPEIQTLSKKLKELQKQAEAYGVKEEFSRIYNRNGASDLNATTSKDVTSYFVELPVSKLELWAYLESERLKHPVFREFYSERDVVQEERRMRVDNQPFGKNLELTLLKAYEKSPFRFPLIGYQKDIQNLSATDLAEFYKKYYVPSRMVGAVVGDIDIAQTKKILTQYFGNIPAGKEVAEIQDPEPVQKEEKRQMVSFEARPNIMIAFHKPTLPNREDYVFDLISQVLCEGRTSRFYKSLVIEKKMAQSVSCDSSTPGSRLSNLFFVYASPLGNYTTADVEKAIRKVLEDFKASPISEQEYQRALHQLSADLIFRMDSNSGLASDLTYAQAVAGDWRYLFKHLEILKQITPKEIQEVAQKYFVKSNSTVSVLSKGKGS